MAYKKCDDAKKNTESLLERIYPYIVDGKKEESVIPNSGQLKFIKGTMVRSLAVSTRVRAKKGGFIHFFLNCILENNDCKLAYLDKEANLKAYFETPYAKKYILYRTKLERADDFFPYLLLERIKTVMEEKLHAYLRIEKFVEHSGDKEDMESEMGTEKKKEKYVELLYCLALYEIFLTEFLKDKSKYLEEGNNQADEIYDELEGLIEKYVAGHSELEEKIEQLTEQYFAANDRVYLTITYLDFFLQHFVNLLAVLRIITIIEYVNINCNEVGEKRVQSEEFRNARAWEETLNAYFEKYNFNLFAFTLKNKNMSACYRELNKMVAESKQAEKSEIDTFRSDVEEYLRITGKKLTNAEHEMEEQRFFKITLRLAAPWIKMLQK